ncbi:MAG: TolB protein [Solirubrobacterales bacterium]|nr:TolB protein [Solirubrobacterales bacterium]
MNPDGSGLVDLTDLAGAPGEGHDPSVAPNGLVAFAVGTGAAGEIWAMGSDGSAPRRLTDDGFADRMPAVSPDGQRIAFASDRGAPTGADLWTIAVDGSDPRPLLIGPGDDLSPQYASDGEHVILATSASGNFDVAYVTIADAPHAAATSITSRSPLDETSPSIQPDRVRLAYAQSDPANPGPSDIFTAYSNDGTDEYPLATDPAHSERSPAFSPDGTEVVYATEAGLVVAAAGGSSPGPLATGQAIAPSDPDWAVGQAVDRSPPETTITKGPKPESKRTTARFRFSSSEPGSSFRCRLDGRPLKPCESPREYRRLDVGRHRFAVEATDAAGNRDPSPAKARFRVLRVPTRAADEPRRRGHRLSS